MLAPEPTRRALPAGRANSFGVGGADSPDAGRRGQTVNVRRLTHEETANEALLWHSIAYELLDAANVLYADTKERQRRYKADGTFTETVIRPMNMVYAFALETLIKALMLSEGQRAMQGTKLTREFHTHEIPDLYKRTKLGPLTAKEAKLSRISDAVCADRPLSRP